MSEYRALYRKWRPNDFDDVWGQDAVTDILKYEVAQNKISHAYLFCGSRGTGKTSCAKILAKAVNCLHPKDGNPCNACEACRSIDRGVATDVIEMDAASNNGVDNVRDLKDEIAFTPAELKYRVYIIDEVHMMSSSAFNALLKTLEEPPTYVVFILATTEFNKLPTTIVSRCQRFDFRRIAMDVLVRRIRHIADREGISLTDEGATMIARAAQGGMRDAVSLLELCAGARETIDADLVSRTVGAGDREGAYRMIGAVSQSDFASVYATMRDIVMRGADICDFFRELIEAYRDLMIAKTTDIAHTYLDLTDTELARLTELAAQFSMPKLYYHTSVLQSALMDMQRASDAVRGIAEIALTRMCDPKLMATPEALAARVDDLEKQISAWKLGAVLPTQPSDVTASRPIDRGAADIHDTSAQPSKPSTAVGATQPKPYGKWARVVERIGEIKRSLSVQFISATAEEVSPRSILLTMNPFFAKKLSGSDADIAMIKGVIAELESCHPSEIAISIREKGGASGQDPTDELDRALGRS